MATARKVGGYAWREECGRALSTNREAREIVEQFVRNTRLGPTTQAVLLAQLAGALSTNLDALVKLREIGRGS